MAFCSNSPPRKSPNLTTAFFVSRPAPRLRDPIAERDLRPITAVLDWEHQREMWAELARTRLGNDLSPDE